MTKRKSQEVQIGNLKIGGNNPIAIQTMTNTDTANVKETFTQICELIDAGAEMVRVTVMDRNGAKAVPEIKKLMIEKGYDVPLIGDFHFIGHELLEQEPKCAEALDKYRINPGNVGRGDKKDDNFNKILDIAIKNKKVIRIGVNAGSIDQDLFTSMMDENMKSESPKSDKEVLRNVMVKSAILSTEAAIKRGIPKNKIVVSVKVSNIQDVIACYEMLAAQTDYCLHVGLTEAGQGLKGVVATSAALGVILQDGIGDTIRVSITPTTGSSRTEEVKVAKMVLQTMDFRKFQPLVTSCPGCGRTSSTFFQTLAEEVNKDIEKNINEWKNKYKGVENLVIAVMGCVVNGPGESRHADIGISLPGKAEEPFAPVYIDGKPFKTLRGKDIAKQFKQILFEYIEKRFG